VADYRAAIDLVERTAAVVQTIANALHRSHHGETAEGVLDAEFAARYAGVLDAAAEALEGRIAAPTAEGKDAGSTTAVSSGVLDALERDVDPRRAGSLDGVELRGALLLAARGLFQELSV
jgi:hypothetical protein